MSKKQINGWEIKDFTKYLIKKEHFLDQAAYLRHEVDPDFDKMENTEPILPILRCNSTTTYLRKKGTDEVFIRTERLAERDDMEPYYGPASIPKPVTAPNGSFLAEAIENDEPSLFYKLNPSYSYIPNPSYEYRGPLPDGVWVKIKETYKLLLAATNEETFPATLGSNNIYKSNADDLRKFFTNTLGERPKFLFLEKKDSEKEVEARGKKTAALFQPGLGWGDITVTLRDRDLVSIKTPTSEGRYSPAKLEMTDKRKGNQTKEVWRTLMLFCLKTGFVSSENTTGEKDLPGKAKRFNKAMKDLFNIKESIFNSHYKNKLEGLKCKLKVAGYETKAQFRSSLSLNCSVEDYINESQDFDIEHPYKEYVSVDSLDDTEDE